MPGKIASPIVVDLGRTRGANIRQFSEGVGQLVDDVEQVMRLVRQDAGPQDQTKVFVPIIAVYRRARGDRNQGS